MLTMLQFRMTLHIFHFSSLSHWSLYYSSHMQSVTPNVFAKLCDVKLHFEKMKDCVSQVTCDISRVMHHESCIMCHMTQVSCPSFLTHNILPSVNFLCLFWLFLYCINKGKCNQCVFCAFVCHGWWHTDGWRKWTASILKDH